MRTLLLLIVRYGEANRSGHDSHWKDSLLLTVPKRRGYHTLEVHMWKDQGPLGGSGS